MHTKWFFVPVEVWEREGLESRLAGVGFTQQGEEYQDEQERVVRIGNTQVQVGIPASDTVNEQEQVEFLVAILGLDDDHIQSL